MNDGDGRAPRPPVREDVIAPRLRARRYLWGLAVALVVACIVALVEIDAQTGRIVDSQGRAWPVSVLVGPGSSERDAGWTEVLSGLITDPLYRALLSWHLVIDLVLVAASGCLLAGLVVVLFRSRAGRIFLWIMAGATVAAALVENLLIVALMIIQRPTALQTVLWWCTTLKWVLLIGVGGILLLRFVVPQRRDDDAETPRSVVVRTRRALMHHRFSVAMIIPLVVLTMLSGSAILEQLPDVQRRWVSDGARGWLQALCAIVALLALGFLLEILARFRTGWAERHRTPESEQVVDRRPETTPRPPTVTARDGEHWTRTLLRALAADLKLVRRPRELLDRLRRPSEPPQALLGLWLLGALIPAVAAIVAAVAMESPVIESRLAVFCLVPVAVVIISWVLRRAWELRPQWYVEDRPPHFGDLEVSTIRFVGRALALTAITVGGIGLVRSFVSVVALGPALTGVGLGPATLFLVLGIAAVVLPWVISWALTAGADRMPDPLASLGTEEATTLLPRGVLLGVVLTLFVLIAVLPGLVAHLGVSAVAIASLTLLIGIPAAAGLLIQERPTAEVFRILGLRRTPVVSVLVITIVIGALTVGGSTIHQVISTPADSPPQRPAVSGMVRDWLGRPGACEVEVAGQRVRPMIMIAAEGGGIRAAYWTVKGLAALDQETGGCGAHSTLFSGGASGGSVGLTVARFSGTPDDPGTARAVDAVEAMAEPDTLGQAVIGTFVRDPVYATTGVPLGTFGVAPAGSWADRARLIELGWSNTRGTAPWGTTSYLTEESGLSPATGPLVLNSSSVASQCRAWVSQLELEQSGASGGEQRCDRRIGPGARTVDVFAAYGPVAGTGSDCLGTVSASTAALLTARFPYVTPGGVVGGCSVDDDSADFWPRTQLIDGGYIENTGLATITDLSAQWLAQVRTHNDAVVAGRSPDALIIPFVVFLTNEQATAGRLTEPPALQSELLLPAVGYLSGSATLTRTDALLQRVSTTVRTRSICPPPGTGTVDCDTVADAFPRRVIVVDRTAQPEVTAPLGWVLSQASMTGLDRAMQHQVKTTCATSPSEPSCLRGYGMLGDLLQYLQRS
jgi:hypothetical protein